MRQDARAVILWSEIRSNRLVTSGSIFDGLLHEIIMRLYSQRPCIDGFLREDVDTSVFGVGLTRRAILHFGMRRTNQQVVDVCGV